MSRDLFCSRNQSFVKVLDAFNCLLPRLQFRNP